MKRLLLLIAFLLTAAAPAAARANWTYWEYQPGWFERIQDGANDGWIYVRSCNYCGQCYYTKYQAIEVAPTYNSVSYTIPEANFDVGVVNALNAEKERQHRERVLQQSGLMQNPNGSYSPAGQGAYGMSGTYFNTLTQGFNPSGSTIWGAAALPSVHYEDAGPEIHEFQQTVKELGIQSAQTTNNLGGLIDHHATVVASNNAALTTELMRNNRILALGIASQTSSVQTSAGTFAPAYPAGQQPQANPPPNPQPPATAPATPPAQSNDADLRQSYLAAGWAYMGQYSCIKCHSADTTAKAAVDFTALESMSDKDRGTLGQEAWTRMHLPITDPKHMPRGVNGQPPVMLDNDRANPMATKILGKTGPAEAPPAAAPEKK